MLIAMKKEKIKNKTKNNFENYINLYMPMKKNRSTKWH